MDNLGVGSPMTGKVMGNEVGQSNMECAIHSCCLCCMGSEQTCFMPISPQECCGEIAFTKGPCTKSKSMVCILPGHQAYLGMLQGRKDICCICCEYSEAIIKPNWLSGERSCYSGGKKSGCQSSRYACLLNEDVPGRCGYCGCYCCPCGCCPHVKPFDETSFGGYGLGVQEVKPEKEYLLCACIFCHWSMFIPDNTHEFFGGTDKCVCCCDEGTCYLNMLPTDDGAGETLFMKYACARRCIFPTTLYKCVSRRQHCLFKGAFPCDAEVPPACAICGIPLLCMGKTTNVHCGTHIVGAKARAAANKRVAKKKMKAAGKAAGKAGAAPVPQAMATV